MTDFNGTKLLDGTLSASVLVGANGAAAESIGVVMSTAHTASGLSGELLDGGRRHLEQPHDLRDVPTPIDAAISTVSTSRSSLGAIQDRLEHTVKSLGVAVESLSASRSRIRDADIAEETSRLVTQQILMQAGTAVLSQAEPGAAVGPESAPRVSLPVGNSVAARAH